MRNNLPCVSLLHSSNISSRAPRRPENGISSEMITALHKLKREGTSEEMIGWKIRVGRRGNGTLGRVNAIALSHPLGKSAFC